MTAKKLLFSRILLVVLLLMLVLLYTGAPIYARIWHLIHGNSVQCGNRTIPVPSGWFSYKVKGDCRLATSSPEYTIGKRYPMGITFDMTSGAPSPTDDQWKQDVINRFRRGGNSLTGVKELFVAGALAVCFEWSTPAKVPEMNITCNVDKQMIVVFNYNDRKWEGTFYDLLRSIR